MAGLCGALGDPDGFPLEAMMVQATIFLACVHAFPCESGAKLVIPLEVPRLTCVISAQQAVALAWSSYKIEKLECPI